MPNLGPISGGAGSDELTVGQLEAINAANSPSGANPFVTIDDLPADELTADQLAAIQGANSPSGANVFATMADITSPSGTNLGTNYTADSVEITNTTGTSAIINDATSSDAGVLSAADKTKLDTLEAYPPTLTESGTTRTLALADSGSYIRLTNAAACAITLPNDATVVWAADTEIAFRIANTGIPTFSLGAGVTLNNSAAVATMVQHNTFAIKRVAANTWDLI